MATEPKRIYLDTNVLAYAANTATPQHRAALEVCRPSTTEQLCVSSQVLAEFYAYITNPSILQDPLDPLAAISRIQRLCQMEHICVLPTPLDLEAHWLALLEKQPVSGGRVFDMLHIAIMLANQVNSIYTFNAKDFLWCPEIEVIVPA